jgi:hypothetical protein
MNFAELMFIAHEDPNKFKLTLRDFLSESTPTLRL